MVNSLKNYYFRKNENSLFNFKIKFIIMNIILNLRIFNLQPPLYLKILLILNTKKKKNHDFPIQINSILW